MSDATISLCVLGGAVALFVWNRLPVEIVAIAVALALYATGVVDLQRALAGFADPVVVFLASLFVVSEGIDATGVTARTGQLLGKVVGDKRRRLLVLAMAMSAGLAALISPNGAVAALLPMVVMTARRSGQSPSVVAMPLAFSASAGALLVLTGSPVNLLVSEAAVESGRDGFGFLSFAWVGVPLVLGTIAIVTGLAPRLLAKCKSPVSAGDLSQHAQTLARDYETLDAKGLLGPDRGVAEVVVPPRSRYVGDKVAPGMRTEGGRDIIAIQRAGRARQDALALKVGDALVVQGTWERLEQEVRDDELLVVDSPELIRRQAVPMGPRAGRAVAIVLPVAMASAAEMGVSPRPFLMLVTVACATSFLTPIGTPANMMVMGPGGYRFGDYWRLGLPLMAWFLVVSIVIIPVIWPFRSP
jgi:di/tricarboxylate transporter